MISHSNSDSGRVADTSHCVRVQMGGTQFIRQVPLLLLATTSTIEHSFSAAFLPKNTSSCRPVCMTNDVFTE